MGARETIFDVKQRDRRRRVVPLFANGNLSVEGLLGLARPSSTRHRGRMRVV